MWHVMKRILRTGIKTEPMPEVDPSFHSEAQSIHLEILTILSRALTIRQVDAGSCNGCELEINALNNPYYNLEGMGIKFVASPRHADLLLVTGPVSRHMEVALKRTYDATPAPKLVVAVGECACTGGLFGESYASCGKVENVIPVDLIIQGCPPPPIEILKGILTAIRASYRPLTGRTDEWTPKAN
jgi:Ni,Fe-hydrogenase III small subunit